MVYFNNSKISFEVNCLMEKTWQNYKEYLVVKKTVAKLSKKSVVNSKINSTISQLLNQIF